MTELRTLVFGSCWVVDRYTAGIFSFSLTNNQYNQFKVLLEFKILSIYKKETNFCLNKHRLILYSQAVYRVKYLYSQFISHTFNQYIDLSSLPYICLYICIGEGLFTIHIVCTVRAISLCKYFQMDDRTRNAFCISHAVRNFKCRFRSRN